MPRTTALRWLTAAAFVLALALVIARATIEENVRDREMIIPGAAVTPSAAGATCGLVLDLLLSVPALIVLWRAAADRTFILHRFASTWIFAAMALLAALSPRWASDRFAAAITAAHLIAAAALMWAMSQLARSWTRLRLVAAACFGILLIYAAQGAMARFIDLPDNINYWHEHQAEELEKRGYEPGSFAARRFEEKLLSGELYGFHKSPNTYAALIVLLGLVSAGAAIQRVAHRDEPGWAIAVLIALAISGFILYYTYCRTAAITPAMAAAMLGLTPFLRQRWKQKFYFAGVISFLFATAALVGHGLYHGTLFHISLTYRWYYWTGAAKILLHHPLLGVGWSNFGAHYLGIRLPIATEEVKDPHNLIVRAAVELGIIGGLLMVAWLARSWWELTQPPINLPDPPNKPQPQKTSARLIVGICALAMAFNCLASIDFFVNSPGSSWFVLLELFKRLLFFVLLLLGVAVICLRGSKSPLVDDRPSPWILRGILAGLAVFLVHNLIDFAIFEPGATILFAMLVGAALGARHIESSPRRASQALYMAMASFATLFWLAAGIGILVPVATAENLAKSADADIRANRLSMAAEKLKQAYDSLWISNADYAYRAAVAMQQAAAPPQQVREMLDLAATADPMHGEYALAAAQFEMHLPHPLKERVIAGYDRALRLDPNSISAHESFGDALLALNEPARAAEQFQLALKYNDGMAPDDPKRLSPADIARIAGKSPAIGK